MNFNTINDRQLADGFKSHYKMGAIYLIAGLFLSFIFIGIPIVIYGMIRLFRSQQFKKEIQRRVQNEGYNPYGQLVKS